MAEWHEGLDPALVEHATAKGWIKEGVGAEDVAKEAVKARAAGKTVMVVLDSDHRALHVRRELKTYAEVARKLNYQPK